MNWSHANAPAGRQNAHRMPIDNGCSLSNHEIKTRAGGMKSHDYRKVLRPHSDLSDPADQVWSKEKSPVIGIAFARKSQVYQVLAELLFTRQPRPQRTTWRRKGRERPSIPRFGAKRLIARSSCRLHAFLISFLCIVCITDASSICSNLSAHHHRVITSRMAGNQSSACAQFIATSERRPLSPAVSPQARMSFCSLT